VVAQVLFVMHGRIRCPTLAVKVEDVRRSLLGFAFSGFDEAEVANACPRCISLLPVHEGPLLDRRLSLDRQGNVQRGKQESHVVRSSIPHHLAISITLQNASKPSSTSNAFLRVPPGHRRAVTALA
jgi:hypothetical protein